MLDGGWRWVEGGACARLVAFSQAPRPAFSSPLPAARHRDRARAHASPSHPAAHPPLSRQVLLDVATRVQGSGPALEHLARVVEAVRRDGGQDDLSALFGALSLGLGEAQADAGPGRGETPMQDGDGGDAPATLGSNLALTFAHPSSGPAPHDRTAEGEGEAVRCPHCGGLVAASRMDAHLSLWCHVLHG